MRMNPAVLLKHGRKVFMVALVYGHPPHRPCPISDQVWVVPLLHQSHLEEVTPCWLPGQACLLGLVLGSSDAHKQCALQQCAHKAP